MSILHPSIHACNVPPPPPSTHLAHLAFLPLSPSFPAAAAAVGSVGAISFKSLVMPCYKAIQANGAAAAVAVSAKLKKGGAKMKRDILFNPG